ncbi:hypothetical protein XM53_00035 [Roseovarius atlanticus]|uniref:Uncharacterized protein n=2 Tax=Roseovarius atlanticus TaxID=1641875 RepID=A0A0T5P155_9RHOB|nr:hypothetical protein XM53_00035 [Roseovarius atlanticus]
MLEAPGGLGTTAAVAIRPGKMDRAPTGTALLARMAVLQAHGRAGRGDRLTARSLIGSMPATNPDISARKWTA